MAADYSHLLPAPVLDRILETAFHPDSDSDRFPDRVQLTALASLGKAISASVRRILARQLVLHDDDNRLVDAEQGDGQSALLLARVVKDPNWANDVKHLTVVNPALEANDSAQPSPPPPPPLDDAAFFLCLSRFDNLSSFTWHSHRVPPELLCLALGQAAKNLTSFKLELVPPSGATTTTDAGAPSSPPLQHQSPTVSGLYSPLLHGGGVSNGTTTTTATTATATAAVQPRWDAPHLASLPEKLTHLSLSNLSSLGAQSLAEHALPSLPLLETVHLEKTSWVDDHVLEAIGRRAKALRVLRVREMAGTKLSENGLGEVLRGCPELRELHLDCVQGALSLSLSPAIPSLSSTDSTTCPQQQRRSRGQAASPAPAGKS